MILQPQSTNHNSRPQKQFFWSATKIATSGKVFHKKSEIYRLPITLCMLRVKPDKSDWLRIWNKFSGHAQKNGPSFSEDIVYGKLIFWIIVISRMIMAMMKHNRKQADWRLSSMIFCFRFQRELYDVSEDKLTCPWKVMRILVKVMLYNVATA